MRAAKLSTKQSDVPGTSHIPLPARSGRKVSSPFIPQFRPRRCSVTKTIGLSFGQGCSGLSDHSKHRRAYINSRRSPSTDSTASDCNDQTTKKAETGAFMTTSFRSSRHARPNAVSQTSQNCVQSVFRTSCLKEGDHVSALCRDQHPHEMENGNTLGNWAYKIDRTINALRLTRCITLARIAIGRTCKHLFFSFA